MMLQLLVSSSGVTAEPSALEVLDQYLTGNCPGSPRSHSVAPPHPPAWSLLSSSSSRASDRTSRLLFRSSFWEPVRSRW